jgi:hypothetical protein
MASAKYIKAMAMQTIVIQRASSFSGEVQIAFAPPIDEGQQLKPILLNSARQVDVLKRVGVTLEDVKRSNLRQLVDSGTVDLVL